MYIGTTGRGIILTVLMSLPIAVEAADYIIDTKGGHAAITFKYKHIGISWLTGHFKTFSGNFSYDENDVSASKIQVDIDVTSLDSNHAERDKHLRSDDYLDAKKFPRARFVSTRIVDLGSGQATIFGDFTFRGVTREVKIDASITGAGKDPWGGYRVGFEGTTTLDTRSFNMKMPPTNEIELALFIEGIRQ